MSIRTIPSSFARLAAVACLVAGASALAAESVTLQLNGKHSFRFAGYYAAKAMGYYADEGFDVDFREADPGEDVVEAVTGGKVRFGVGSSGLLVARSSGKPVVALAVILQKSPAAVFARRREGGAGLRDLVGARVMIEPKFDDIRALLRKEGITLEELRVVEHSHDVKDLIEGRVDAMSGLITEEPFFLDQARFGYRVFAPGANGIDFYGDNLFTAEREVKENARRVAAFREASLRGWRYALEHPEKVIDLIVADYARGRPREFYAFEAARVATLVRNDLVEVGHMNPERWRQIAETFIDMRLLPASVSLEGFLYQPVARADMSRIYAFLGAALALLAIAGGVVVYVQRTNGKLRQALQESREAHDAQRASEERMRLLAEHASDVIWTRDLRGRFTYVSPAVVRMRGFTVEEALAQGMDDALVPRSAAAMRDGLARLLQQAAAGESDPEFRGEFEQLCADGSTIWVETTATVMRGDDDRIAGVVGVTRDITERKRTEERIRELALHDSLTGLPNRKLFSDRLGTALAAAHREARRVALMFIDLDKFKPVNDTYGHAVGDLLLKEVAVRMVACVRESDTVGRIGGDEFVVLLRSVESAREGRAVAEKIRQAIVKPFELSGQRLEISCSIGIAIYPDHGKSELELSQKADVAMYWAKEHGRDSVQLYGPELEQPG